MENKIVPKLRFSDFENHEEWLLGHGNKIFAPISDKLHNSDLPILAITQDQGAIPRNEINYNVIVSDKSVESYKVVQVGDFIISLRSFQGGIEYSKYKGICSPVYIVLRKKTNIVEDFFKHYFKTNNFIFDLNKNIEGIRDGKMVSYKQFSDLLLPRPSVKEQQKIADCLSSLDDLITAEIDKLAALQKHKGGLMQQLFPTEEEKVPKLRFPEFRDNGAWNNNTVGGNYDFKVTNSFPRENLNYKNGKIKNIHYGDIHKKFNTLFDIINEEVPYINLDISTVRIKPESYCIEGDVVFADASEDLNDIGKSIEIINLNNEKLVSGLHTLLARQKDTMKLYIGFAGYLFKSPWLRKQIQREAQGAKVLGISTGRISKVKILYPDNPKEQQKIVEALSSLDDQISLQKQKTENLKILKKGLMQQLFPNLN